MPRGRLTAELLAFYLGEGPGGSGHTLPQILAWPNDDWERHHDFIQWVFPTDEASAYNPAAPVLDAHAVALFRADPARRARLGESFGRWLGFCGIALAGDGSLGFARPNPAVWGRRNHNWLRVSRVLLSLNLLGRESDAAAFLALPESIRPQTDAETWGHWARAGAEISSSNLYTIRRWNGAAAA